MSDRFFVDTNVFIYSFDQAAPQKARKSEALIRSGIQTGKAVISYQVMQEFFNVALRRFSPPMTIAEADNYLSLTLGRLIIVPPSQALFRKALQLSVQFSLSWYDSLIVGAALEGDCSVLFTEDLQHGQKIGNLAVENPFL